MSTENLISADEAQRLLDGRATEVRWCKADDLDEPRGLVSDDPRYAGYAMLFLAIKNGVAIVAYEGDAALMAAAPALAETVIALHAEVARLTTESERLRTAAHAMGDAEEALAQMDALKPGASVAYLEMDGRPDDSISADFDSDAAPRITLALSLFPGDPEPWQALVEYEGGMGAIPVVSGECCERASAALASLQEEIARGHGGTDE